MKKLKKYLFSLFCNVLVLSLNAAEPKIVSVTAQQRYPWNGLVDIEVQLSGTVEELAGCEVVFAATNVATQAELETAHIEKTGEDVGSGESWTRHYVWDAEADVGKVKIDGLALTVGITKNLAGVQLWEGGPYFAECNVGATKPEEYGYYFWWGDTIGCKRNVANNGWVAIKNGAPSSFSNEICPTYDKTNQQLQSLGYIDSTSNLIATHDAATVHLGAPWRMPTASEIDELSSNCTVSWTEKNGIHGVLVVGKDAYVSKEIFLPAGGLGKDSGFLVSEYSGSTLGSDGYYWSSTPYSEYVKHAWGLGFDSYEIFKDRNGRGYGLLIRPVRESDSNIPVSSAETHFAYWEDLIPARMFYKIPQMYEVSSFTTNAFPHNLDVVSTATGFCESADLVVNSSVPSQTAGAYSVLMFMEAEKHYEFAAEYDDRGIIRVDGECVADGTYNAHDRREYSPLWTGWHAVDLIVWNNGGAGGATGSLLGLRWRTGDSEEWRQFSAAEYPDVFCIIQTGTDSLEAIQNVQLENVVLDDGVAGIPDGLFVGQSALTNLTILGNIAFVGKDAFVECNNLHTIHTDVGVSWYLKRQMAARGIDIGDIDFVEPEHNYTLVFDLNGEEGSIDSIECRANEDIVLPSEGPYWENHLIAGWALRPNGEKIFKAGEVVRNLNLAKNGTLRLYAVWEELWSTRLTDGVIAITGGPNLQGDVVMPDTIYGYPVTEINYGAFWGNTSITSIVVADSVETIGAYAFREMRSLRSVVLPKSVKTLPYGLFFDSPSLISVEIQEGVEVVEQYAFWGCWIMPSIKLPSTLTRLDYGAFFNCYKLKVVDIPDGVESIGNCCFWYDIDLEVLRIPNSVAKIEGPATFIKCDKLSTVYVDAGDAERVRELMRNTGIDVAGLTFVEVLPDGGPYTKSVDGVEYTFYVSNGEATIGNGYSAAIPASTSGDLVIPLTLGGCPVTTIGEWAFSSCSSLTSVTIPEGVTTIGDTMFSGCSSLTSVTIPESVTTIGSYAFYNCSSLESVTIPSSVTTIGEYAFSGCSKLQSFTVAAANPSYCTIDGILYTKDHLRLVACPGAKTLVTIPEGVTTIGALSFYNCSSLTSVTIPSSVTTIGNYAFSDCSKFQSFTVAAANPSYCTIDGILYTKDRLTLVACPGAKTSVAIPEGVTTIGESAFYGCRSLTSVTIPEGVTTIVAQAFVMCSSLTSITIPESVTTIGVMAFSACSSLTSVTIPSSVTTIGDWAFYSCSSLTSVTIPDSVTTIGERAFYYCSSLTSVTIPESVTTIGERAFYNCRSLTSVTIPSSVTTIGSYAFYGCSSLTAVTIQEGVTTIGDWAFYSCSSLTSVTIPDSVTTIGERAFYYCSSLTSVTIPESVTTIGNYAFCNCSFLESVTIPSSVTTIGNGVFVGCSSLKTVYVDYGDTDRVKELVRGKGVDVDTLTFVEAAYKLVIDENGCVTGFAGELPSELVIPNGVKAIGQETFKDCTTITSIKLPSSVTSIGKRAFYGCENLETVIVPTDKPNIGSQAFFGVPWYENAVVDYASGASQTVANSVTVTNVVVHYVLNSVQPEFAKPVSEDTGFVNVIAEVKGMAVAVPQTWAVNYPQFAKMFGSDFTKALTKKTGKIAAGGREMLVWEDYVAGTDPTDLNDKFTASMTIVDGKPVISWTPELDAERAALRTYTTYGKVKLTDSEWTVVPEGRASDYNFFKVTVEMK